MTTTDATSTETTGPIPITPIELADVLRPLLGTALVGFDVDGVLAPLVDHADDSRLAPGVAESLAALSRLTVGAILSGRSLESLERLFDFAEGLHVIGSHGLEIRGEAAVELSGDEQYTFDQLEIIGTKGVEAVGDGAWLEYKPASVVVHTRSADPDLATPALQAITNLVRMIDGAQVKPGHHVLELLARTASKGQALLQLGEDLDRSPLVFFGDDVTDEDAFALMGPDDISIRVGDGESVARYRLDGPEAAAEVLRLITAP